MGVVFLFVAWQFRTSIAFVLLICAMVFYLQQSVSANSNITEQIVTTLSNVFPEERIQSLEYRFSNEEILAEKAKEKMIFGWGGWGRNRVFDYDTKGYYVDVSTTDSLWILAFGRNGIIGLISVFGSIFIPAISFALLCCPAETWSHYKVASAAVIAIIIVLYAFDCLLNNQFNPVFILATGGIAGLVVQRGYA